MSNHPEAREYFSLTSRMMVSLHAQRQLMRRKGHVTCLNAHIVTGVSGQNAWENTVELEK